MSPIKLIVGLANPGKEYAQTRHNAGAWFVHIIADQVHTSLRRESKFRGMFQTFELDKQSCALLIPTTFMNLSGQSVRACMDFYKIRPEEILVAHDDLDLPTGKIKLKMDGGDGGHNGLKDIISHLHTKKFNRLRIGIGRPSHNYDVIDYVLSAPPADARAKINLALQDVVDHLNLLLAGNLPQAMQILHTENNGIDKEET